MQRGSDIVIGVSEVRSDAGFAITLARARFVDALRAGDVDGACGVYAVDAQLLPPSGRPLRGAQQIRKFWQAGLESGMSGLELECAEVNEHDDICYEIGRYTLRVHQTTGTPVIEHGHYVQIHHRQSDGSWERAVEIFSPGGGE